MATNMNNMMKHVTIKASKRPSGVTGMPFLLKFEGTADSTSAILPACEVVDAWCVMTGAGATSDTWKLTDGTNDITDTVDVSSAGDTDRVAVGEIDDAYSSLSAGAQITCTRASAANCDVYALCVMTA